MHLIVCVFRVRFRIYRPLNLRLSCEIVKKGGFGPRFVGEGIPRFRTYIFKLRLRPTMWPDMVEFCSANSGIRGRIKRKKESMVKHKSGGRPN